MAWKPSPQLRNCNLYQVLEVENFAGPDTLRQAYRALALRCHPDRVPDGGEATRRFILGTEAYRILTDQNLRKHHDRWLRGQLRQSPVFQNSEWKLQRRRSTRGVYLRGKMAASEYERFIEECRRNFRLFLQNGGRVKTRPRIYHQEAMEPGEYDTLVEEGRSDFQDFLRAVPRYPRR